MAKKSDDIETGAQPEINIEEKSAGSLEKALGMEKPSVKDTYTPKLVETIQSKILEGAMRFKAFKGGAGDPDIFLTGLMSPFRDVACGSLTSRDNLRQAVFTDDFMAQLAPYAPEEFKDTKKLGDILRSSAEFPFFPMGGRLQLNRGGLGKFFEVIKEQMGISEKEE